MADITPNRNRLGPDAGALPLQRYDIESQGWRRQPLDRRLRQAFGVGRVLARGARALYSGFSQGAPIGLAAAEEMRRRSRMRTLASVRRAGPRFGRRRRRAGYRVGSMITTQRDNSVRYVGRRRRRGGRFTGRVRRAVANMQASNVYTVDGQKVQTSLANQVAYWGTVLSATTVEDSELTNMFTDKYGAGNIANTKICVRNQCLDVEMKNNGSNTVVMDVYEVKLRRVCANQTIEAQYTNLYNVPATSVSKSANDPGSSPFCAPEFCRMWKILAKREVRIGAGEIVTLQTRAPRDRWVNGYRITSDPGYLRGAIGYFFHWHGAPEKNATVSQLAATEMLFNYQKQYSYAIPPGQTQDNVHNA